MNVSVYYTKVYNSETASGSRKNKPNSNPIKPRADMERLKTNKPLTNFRLSVNVS
jgi:hypothetical protein